MCLNKVKYNSLKLGNNFIRFLLGPVKYNGHGFHITINP